MTIKPCQNCTTSCRSETRSTDAHQHLRIRSNRCACSKHQCSAAIRTSVHKLIHTCSTAQQSDFLPAGVAAKEVCWKNGVPPPQGKANDVPPHALRQESVYTMLWATSSAALNKPCWQRSQHMSSQCKANPEPRSALTHDSVISMQHTPRSHAV